MTQSVKQPFSENYWDEVETWPRERIEAFQLEALKKQLRRVAETSPHYRDLFAAAGFDPAKFNSLADQRKLPFSKKSDYVAGLAALPPYGSFAAMAPGDAVPIHFSPGTTAARSPVLW